MRSHTRSSIDRAVGRIALCAVVALAGGCASTGDDGPDAVESAKTINRNLERGQRLMSAARADFDMSDPSENLRGLPKLIDAEKLFFEARKLSPNSSKPRMALGNCRALIGYVYFSHHTKYLKEAEEAVKRGEEPPARVISERDRYYELAAEWLKKSNRELEFYARFLMAQFPQPLIYEALATNYEYLNDYKAAESMLRVFVESVQLSRDQRKYYDAKIRSLRSKQLDEFEG